MIQVGDNIPAGISLQYMDGKKIKRIKSDALFAKKKTALFSVPAAFSPPCSEIHLGGYVAHSFELKKKGIDQIICIAVNDAFVMDAWAKANHVKDEVKFIADGNGEFAKEIGMDVDMSQFALGLRSARYSMIVDDGKVTMLNTEQGGNIEKSKYDVILDAL